MASLHCTLHHYLHRREKGVGRVRRNRAPDYVACSMPEDKLLGHEQHRPVELGH